MLLSFTSLVKSKYEADAEQKWNNHLRKQHNRDVTVCICFKCAVKQTEKAVWQIKKIPLFVDLYKHNMKLVILLQLLKLVSRNICKEEQIT